MRLFSRSNQAPAAPRLDADAIAARRTLEDDKISEEDEVRAEEDARRAAEDAVRAQEDERRAAEDALGAPNAAQLAERATEDARRTAELRKREREDRRRAAENARRAAENAKRDEEDPILAQQRDELFDGEQHPPAKEKTSHLWVALGLLVGAALGLLALVAAWDNQDGLMAWLDDGDDAIPDDGGDDSVAPPPPAPAPTAPHTPVFPTTSFADRGKLVMTVEVVGTSTKLGAETYRLHEMRQDESGWVIYPSGGQLDLADLKKAGHSQSPHALKKGEKGRVECVEIDPDSCQPG